MLNLIIGDDHITYDPENYPTGKTFTNLQGNTFTIEDTDIALLINPEEGPQEPFQSVEQIREFTNMNDQIYFFLAIKPTDNHTIDQLQALLEENSGLNG